METIKFKFIIRFLKEIRLKEFYFLKQFFLFLLSLIIISCDNNDNNDYTCNDLETNSDSFSFFLQNLNPNSDTYHECIGPDSYPNTVRLFYFSNNEN